MSLIHFIGVGKMGLPMARHLARAGAQVTVQDSSDDALHRAQAAGLTVGGADALARAQWVVSSLPHDNALRAVGQAVAEGARRGAVYVDTSTVSLAASATVAQACEAAGVACVRATVSGNNHMAEAAQLTVMASGPCAAYEAALPWLRTWGPTQFYLGEGEQARLMKLVVNHMIAQTSAMLAEALTLGERGGLDWRQMWDVIAASAVASPIVKAKAVQLRERDYTPTFTVPQMLKDVDLILGEGDAAQVPLPQLALTRQQMLAALAQGFECDDYAAIIKTAARQARKA